MRKFISNRRNLGLNNVYILVAILIAIHIAIVAHFKRGYLGLKAVFMAMPMLEYNSRRLMH